MIFGKDFAEQGSGRFSWVAEANLNDGFFSLDFNPVLGSTGTTKWSGRSQSTAVTRHLESKSWVIVGMLRGYVASGIIVTNQLQSSICSGMQNITELKQRVITGLLEEDCST
jgi:hypothetical protein